MVLFNRRILSATRTDREPLNEKARNTLQPRELEWDPQAEPKQARYPVAANKAKHGIDFIEEQAIWTDVERLEIPPRSLDEARHQVIGRIGEKTWSAFITYRNDKIRIISVRRARADEEARYFAD
jgi:uncharacterized DUF497 family protein